MSFFVDIVKFVNYILAMDNNNNNKNKANKANKADIRDIRDQNNQSGIYLRDDHCDWGSSGMNEFTNEFGQIK